MKKLMLVALLLVATTLLANGGPSVTTVILVRHGEKPSPSTDALSEAGATRAAELARVLQAVKIDAVYTTPYERTRKTAAPLAQKLGLTAVEVNPKEAGYAGRMAKIVREKHEGGTVVIVGHSDTTQEVIHALGGSIPTIDEPIFDNLFIVTLVDGAPAKVLALRYGAHRP
ncbi:MAG TPA: phosphoglycerate mutase family protein [Thermoanaerobaculia bacterium]|nr:phosphoglycerate mutase family protein [Thermoanaerobaculia bacterium]